MIIRATVFAVLLTTLGLVNTHAQSKPTPDPWFSRSSRANDFSAAKLPWKIFTIDQPDDWQIVPGFASTLLTFAERRSGQPAAAIVIEHTQNELPLLPSDVDARFAKNEADFLQRRDPGGKNFDAQVKNVNDQRFMLIQYSKPGFFGPPDHVAVYVFPAGKVMYRLICIAPEAQLAARYQAICAHVAWSFKPVIDAAK
jgi:hypothetical protein